MEARRLSNQGLGSWIGRRAPKSGNKAAIIFDGAELSYLDLNDRVNRLASGLADRGVRTGTRVAYLGENAPAFLEALFAAGVLGAIFVPLNTRLAEPEIRYQLQDSGSEILIHALSMSTLAHRAATESRVARFIEVGSRPGSAAEGLIVEGDILSESLASVASSGSPDPVVADVSLDDPALILYTSGTTGHPKGALLTHGNLTWNALNVLVDYDVVSSDVSLMISPLFHVASLGMGALPAFLKGATVVLESKYDPAVTLRQIEKYRVTSMSGVPTTFQLMCEDAAWESTDLSSLTKLTCGGSPVPARVREAYEKRGLSFTGGYGMTESSPGVTSLSPDRSRDKAVSSGLPHFFTQLRIADPAGQEVGPGVIGEIQVCGPNVMTAYWNHADSTGYRTDDWFRTGDLGYRDDEGFLIVTDRLKDMIISGGENIYPAELERIILELDAVSGVAVIGVPDNRWGEVPVAILTVRGGFIIDEASVRRHLDGRVARYKVPKRVVLVDELPRTASGKVRKVELRERFAEGEEGT